jgi:hypothetical protein
MPYRDAVATRRRVDALLDDTRRRVLDRRTLIGERGGTACEVERSARVEVAAQRQNTATPLRPRDPPPRASRGIVPTTSPTTWGAI